MVTFLLLILMLNIDALSFGIAYGLKKQKIHPVVITFISLLSTFLFAIALALSKYIYTWFNPTVLRLINAFVLIYLGFTYIFKKEKEKNLELKLGFKQGFIECIIISIDAIFTAILSGFNANYYIFAVIFYGFTNIFAIFFGNYFFFYLNKKIKLKLNFLSGFIFIFLGIFKIIGF